MRPLAALLLAGLLGGCSILAPSAEQLNALSQSHRSWCLSVTSIYGVVRVGGSGIEGGTVKCSQEGMEIEAVRKAAPAAKPTP